MTAKTQSLLQIHLVVLLAGGSGLFGKLLHLAPAGITCIRSAVGGLTVAAFLFLTNGSFKLASKKEGTLLAMAGALLAMHWLAFFFAIQTSTVAIGLLGFASFPLFVTFLEPIILREQLRRTEILTALMIVGGLLLVTPRFTLTDRFTQGLLVGILSGLAYALLSILNRIQLRTLPPLTIACYQQLFAALLALPFLSKMNGIPTVRDTGLLLLLGIVFTGLAQSLLVDSLRNLSAHTVAIMLGLEPIYGIALAWLLLNEIPATRTLLGGTIIVITVIWTSYRQTKIQSLTIPG